MPIHVVVGPYGRRGQLNPADAKFLNENIGHFLAGK